VKITDIKLYTVETAGSDYGQGQRARGGIETSKPTVSAHPLSIFDRYKQVDVVDKAFGPWSYAPFVVELETDAGVSGFAVNHGGGALSCRIVRNHFAQFLENRNPFDTNQIWEEMYRSQLPTGQGGVHYMAMSAVDLALWDLKGKLLGRPVYELIGGRTRETLQCYVTTFPAVMHHMVDKGFSAVKVASPYGAADGRRGLLELERVIAEARQLFGKDVGLMVECYMSWDLDFVVKAAELLEKYEVDWIEDPLLADASTSAYREVRNLIKPLRLAVGNLMWGESRFYSLIAEGATDVVQPELQWSGGLTAALRIAAVARGRGIPVIPHTCGVYSYHFTMAHVEAPVAEYMPPGDATQVVAKGHAIRGEPAPVDGQIYLGDAPGFGIELERSVLIEFDGGEN
jgi:L-rhamnonate dehydratase